MILAIVQFNVYRVVFLPPQAIVTEQINTLYKHFV